MTKGPKRSSRKPAIPLLQRVEETGPPSSTSQSPYPIYSAPFFSHSASPISPCSLHSRFLQSRVSRHHIHLLPPHSRSYTSVLSKRSTISCSRRPPPSPQTQSSHRRCQRWRYGTGCTVSSRRLERRAMLSTSKGKKCGWRCWRCA